MRSIGLYYTSNIKSTLEQVTVQMAEKAKVQVHKERIKY
jgi:hypothetical protein